MKLYEKNTQVCFIGWGSEFGQTSSIPKIICSASPEIITHGAGFHEELRQ